MSSCGRSWGRPVATRPLEGLGVVVTRPRHQAAGLVAELERRGARVMEYPLLEVAPPTDEAPARALVDRLDDYGLAIFISANAAQWGLELVRRRGRSLAGLEVAAVGGATARALAAQGVRPAVVPHQRFTSEGLLELLPAERVAGRRIIIFRGEGGRALLADELRARGARVDYAEVYRRVMPQDTDGGRLTAACGAGEVDVLLLTSREAMENLVAIAGPGLDACTGGVRLLVVNEDMVARAREFGFRLRPLVAARPDDASLVAALEGWQAAGRAEASP